MTALRTLYHLARADFLERVRRYSFLILLGLTVYLGYLFVPPVDANYQTVALGDARGIYTSEWIGAMLGLMISTLVTLIAFYPIKNTVERDRQTQVGQIIAATPTRKTIYTLGKWLSNVALLVLLLCVMTGMAVVMQLVRAEDLHVNLWALITPMWLIALPPLCLVAATAVLFECTPFLRSSWGNVAYFFLFIAVLTAWLASSDGVFMKIVNDPFGISYVIADMQQEIIVHNPDYNGQVTIGGSELSAEPLLFRWEGMVWTAKMALDRLSWIGVSAALAIAAALPFDRFDSTRSRRRGSLHLPEDNADAASSPSLDVASMKPFGGEVAPVTNLTPLSKRRFRPRFGGVLRAELRLMLDGRHWTWFIVTIGLNVAGLAVPDDTIRQILHAVAWFWPILLWSSMGNRERNHNTQQIVFSVARPLARQLTASWLAGVCVAAITTAGFAVQYATSDQWEALGAWMICVAFVPSLALALGTWSSSRRTFEVVYTFLWYIGPINQVPALDYIGITQEAVTNGISFYYLAASGALLTLAVLGRWQQMRK